MNNRVGERKLSLPDRIAYLILFAVLLYALFFGSSTAWNHLMGAAFTPKVAGQEYLFGSAR